MIPTGPLVIDTHAFIWYLQASAQLSVSARGAMDEATAAGLPLLVSAASVVELVYLTEKGTLGSADLRAFLHVLDDAESSFGVAPVDGAVARRVVDVVRRTVADPFDRMIAATALALRLQLVTRDRKLAQIPELRVIW